MNVVKRFIKKEPTLCISALLAACSMLAVPPSAEYLGYIDIRVLCLLFCLMIIVAGVQECGLLEMLAGKLISGGRGMRSVSVTMTLLPFFLSMLVTNDVALIAFVPLTILTLKLAGCENYLPRIVVLQTLAANLGSMATPVGNPQNLFLYTGFGLNPPQFFQTVIPVALLSLVGLTAAAACTKNIPVTVSVKNGARVKSVPKLCVYSALFAVCLMSVFHVLSYTVATAVVLAAVLCVSPKLLIKADYCLLLTFVCFFIFAGNIAHIPTVSSVIRGLLEKNTLLTSAAVSQVISNVPAAVLLSGFTENWKDLLLGVNIGGLGTPVASLASLISLKLYIKSENSRPLYYTALFLLANFLGLAALLVLAQMFM